MPHPRVQKGCRHEECGGLRQKAAGGLFTPFPIRERIEGAGSASAKPGDKRDRERGDGAEEPGLQGRRAAATWLGQRDATYFPA